MYEGPGRYRHYKGNLYDVVGVGIHESELYRAVIYKPVKAAEVNGEAVEFWLRPLDDFNAKVKGAPRFTKIGSRP